MHTSIYFANHAYVVQAEAMLKADQENRKLSPEGRKKERLDAELLSFLVDDVRAETLAASLLSHTMGLRWSFRRIQVAEPVSIILTDLNSMRWGQFAKLDRARLETRQITAVQDLAVMREALENIDNVKTEDLRHIVRHVGGRNAFRGDLKAPALTEAVNAALTLLEQALESRPAPSARGFRPVIAAP